jgi:hypothetical protein
VETPNPIFTSNLLRKQSNFLCPLIDVLGKVGAKQPNHEAEPAVWCQGQEYMVLFLHTYTLHDLGLRHSGNFISALVSVDLS